MGETSLTAEGKLLFAAPETSGVVKGNWLQLEPATFADLQKRGKVPSNITWANLTDPVIYDQVANAYAQDLQKTFGIPTVSEAALWSWRPGWYKKYNGTIENIPQDAPGVMGKSGRVVMEQRRKAIVNMQERLQGRKQDGKI